MMRKILTLLSATALLATPAISHARGFDSNFSQAVTGPIKLEIVVSDDLAHRANNKSNNRADRRSRLRLKEAFSNNSYYGDKEIVYLLKEMREELEYDFAKRGITLSDTAPTILRVTIENVKNNRPTIKQLSIDNNLSFRSVSTGGAEITANITSASGETLGQAEYEYYSTFNDSQTQFQSIWGDTNQAFSRFSRHLSKKLAKSGASST